MRNATDYVNLNNRCEFALNELEKLDIDTWLYRSSKLFKAISLQPEGLPSIALANFEGVYYQYISEFHQAYKKHFAKINVKDCKSSA